MVSCSLDDTVVHLTFSLPALLLDLIRRLRPLDIFFLTRWPSPLLD